MASSETPPPTLGFEAETDDAVERWLLTLARERGRSDNTLDAYRRDLAHFLTFLTQDLGRP
ncbi:MAG: site-specific integrase, partial [Pseudomonadota bacterium]